MKSKLIILITIVICSCSPRGCQKIDRAFQMSERNYHLQQYSGGKLINEYRFRGIINSEEQSDGYYFTINDTLIEISGDIIIKSK